MKGAGHPAPFTVSHAPVTALEDDKVLGMFCYGSAPTGVNDPRLLVVPLETIGASHHVEVLHSTLPVERGLREGFTYACNNEVLLAQLKVDATSHHDIEAQAFEAYQRIHAFLDSQSYPHPLRLWNYLDDINAGEGDDEVYKRFCIGRGRALQATHDNEKDLPAASAIGSHGSDGALIIHLLAARTPGIQVENPRQVSAFHYPRQYGIRSPSFSRARVMHWPGVSHLYLSGTASVVGHETLHVGDCHAQIMECLRNIDTVLETAKTAGSDDARFRHEHLKQLRVYLRNREDLATAQTCIGDHLEGAVPAAYLLGDICRKDLLVEVEGLFCHPA